jgi:hypothetical protein
MIFFIMEVAMAWISGVAEKSGIGPLTATSMLRYETAAVLSHGMNSSTHSVLIRVNIGFSF